MRCAAFILGLALVAITAPSARADEGGYGERIVAIDATSDALILVGLFAENEWPAWAGLAGHVVGGPIVHLTHDNAGRAALSLGTRVGLPALGGLVGYAACFDDTGFLRCIGSAGVGLVLGVLAAQIIDPTVIVPEEEPTPSMLTFRF